MQLQEYEIKYLCTKAREIFINQPILLELEAPIKICGACAVASLPLTRLRGSDASLAAYSGTCQPDGDAVM